MKTLAVFLSDDLTLRRFNNAFGLRCEVRSFSCINDVKSIASKGALIASIVDMSAKNDISQQQSFDLITKLYSAHPVIPIIGYVDFSPERARDIVAAAHAGVTDVVLRDVDNLEIAATRILEMETSSNVTWRVSDALDGKIPEQLKEFFLYSIQNAKNLVTVDLAAKRLRRNRKTISNWLSAADLPPPYKIIGWGRVLLAAKLLEDSRRSIENVAREMNFVNGTALRAMIKRYLEMTPDDLRQGGGLELALEKFILALDRQKI